MFCSSAPILSHHNIKTPLGAGSPECFACSGAVTGQLWWQGSLAVNSGATRRKEG